MAEALTTEQIRTIAEAVKTMLAAESQGVGEMRKVTSLSGIYSLPALLLTGGTEAVVEAPLTLLRVSLQKADSAIEWRQGDSGLWQTLITIEDITGPKGETPQFRTGATGIEFKYDIEEDEAWRELVSIDDLKLTFDHLTDAQKEAIRGYSSFQLWQQEEGNIEKTYEDYKAYLKEEALAAAAVATEVATDTLQVKNDTLQVKEETEAVRHNTETVRVATQTVKQETEAVKDATETVRQNTEAERIATNTVKQQTEAVKEETVEKLGLFQNAYKDVGEATERANTAAKNAEDIIAGIAPDWSVIQNKPEIPTLYAAPTADMLTYVNSGGKTVSFIIGDEVRVMEDGEYVFYRLYNLADGVASWAESGGGVALTSNMYLQGANYYNGSVQTIQNGYINE